MRTIVLSAASAAFVSLIGATTASACSGSQCFEQVVSPPLYASEHRTVLVQPERVINHVRPAQYGVVNEPVVIRPEQRIGHIVPAKIRQIAETVMVHPPTRRWEVTTDAWGRTVGCWVEIPAKYVTQYRDVVVHPAHVVEERIPAVIGLQQRSVMVRPATVHQKVIPAQYGTVSHTVQVAPGSVSWQPLR